MQNFFSGLFLDVFLKSMKLFVTNAHFYKNRLDKRSRVLPFSLHKHERLVSERKGFRINLVHLRGMYIVNELIQFT